jgi:hypothetical protein
MGLITDDGRQSETALKIARGTRRLLRALSLSSLSEVSLRNGRRADLMAIGEDGTILIIEIKSSLADFRADQKWREYREACDRLFFAIAGPLLEAIMPQEAGLIMADAYGAAILREAPEHRLPAATRKAISLRFARAAAERLHRMEDPEGWVG